jgi:hypothetical protein
MSFRMMMTYATSTSRSMFRVIDLRHPDGVSCVSLPDVGLDTDIDSELKGHEISSALHDEFHRHYGHA